MTAAEALQQGAAELAEVLCTAGFEFAATRAGRSSGGEFASGAYRRGDRWLELHVRGSLGLVTYGIAEARLAHEDFVRAVRAIYAAEGEPEYPGFSHCALEAFQHLRADLVRFGFPFLSGSDEEFRALERGLQDHPKANGLAALER